MGSDIDRTLAALAEPTRRRVIDLLCANPLRASDIARELSMTRAAMSRHLRVLRKAGIVIESGLEDDARVRVYTLQRERFVELRVWLDEVEAFWSEQLHAFKAYAEAKTRGQGT